MMNQCRKTKSCFLRIVLLLKEYELEKERLEIIIREISERDGTLYEMKYVIEPNPTVKSKTATG